MTRAEREKHEREVVVSRAKLILIIVCLIAIPVTFWINHHDVGTVSKRITKVESPCQRYGPHSNVCKEAFEKAVATITHPEACAVERKAGTLRAVRELASDVGVTFTEPCAGARLAQERRRGNERAATSRRAHHAELGGAQPSPPAAGGGSTGTTGGSKAPHGGSAHPPAPGIKGSNDGEAPTEAPAAAQPERSTQPPSSPPVDAPEPAGPGTSSTPEAQPGLIGNPGGVVGETVCGATDAVNELAGVSVCSK
jgi:hypothetical protein